GDVLANDKERLTPEVFHGTGQLPYPYDAPVPANLAHLSSGDRARVLRTRSKPATRLLSISFVNHLQHRLPNQFRRCVAELSSSEFVDREHRAGRIHGEVHRRIVVVERTVASLAFLERSLRPLALRHANINAHQAGRASIVVVRNEATR